MTNQFEPVRKINLGDIYEVDAAELASLPELAKQARLTRAAWHASSLPLVPRPISDHPEHMAQTVSGAEPLPYNQEPQTFA